MEDLAIDLAIYYQTGTARGEYSLLSSMDVTQAEFFAVFGRTINDLILRHVSTLIEKRGGALPVQAFQAILSSRNITRKCDGWTEPRNIPFTFAACVSFFHGRDSSTSSGM